MKKDSLAMVLIKANKELQEKKFLKNYKIVYRQPELRLEKDGRCFPIADADTEGEVAAAVRAYLSGWSHGREKSYVRLCDEDY